MRTLRPRSGGHAAVEFALSLGLWTAFLAGTVAVFERQLITQRTWAAARFVALIASFANVEQAAAQREIRSYLKALKGPGEWEGVVDRYADTPASRFYRLQRATVRHHAPEGITPAGPEVEATIVIQQEWLP
jgi:hypothetical protein